MSDCVFCKIINSQIPSKKVYEDENVFAFQDISPQAKNHILFVTKKHYPDVEAINQTDELNNIFKAIAIVAKQLGVDKTGYRVVTNKGVDAGQTVFHVHFHMLSGQRLSDKMA